MDEHRLDDVLAAAALGQGWALRVLYEQLAPQVFGYLRSRGAREPEDLTSEVFLTVFTRLGSVTGGAAGLRTLVFSIAHARLVDEFRRRARQPATIEYDAGTDRRQAPSAEDAALAGIDASAVRTLIESLRTDQRDVLLLRLIGDLTVEQTAAALGKTIGSVKQLQRRALITLKEHLKTDRVPIFPSRSITRMP